jgi:hypothetical protein
MSSLTSDSKVNHDCDSEARDLIRSPPSQPIGWEDFRTTVLEKPAETQTVSAG